MQLANPSVSPGVAGRPDAPAPPVHGAALAHAVQFYESDDFLTATVADFLAPGLAAGQPGVVIATPAHGDAFAARLESLGVDVARACRGGQLTLLDARATLDTFMVGARPDARRFRATVGRALDRARRRNAGVPVRAYGEMVDLLWTDGNTDGALRLEELWNELARGHGFSLLCAYAMGGFLRETDGAGLREICHRHSHVVPAEGFTQADEAGRLTEIALLQQRARALEAEVAHRGALEARLREELAARRRAEDRLRESEADLKDILEHAAEGIHCVGPDGTILWANDAELALLGYARDEYVGRHIAEFYADPGEVEAILARLGRCETLRNQEARLRCRDGSVRHVLINSNVRWRDGQFVHTRCFTRDVTEIRAAADARERLLERERAARTAAEDANRARSEFLARMSHELRTPLNVIGGHVQLVEMGVHGPLTEAQRDALARVQRSQHQLLSLINDVLNLVRAETGRVQYTLEAVPAAALLRDLATTVEPLLVAGGLACEVVEDADGEGVAEAPPAVRADQEKLEQLLLNLLTNAIKFTPAGGRITLAVGPSPGDPGVVRIRVRDTGVGIPAVKLESVFEPFVQLGTRQYTPQQGVGLGLAISRELARGMGGELAAASPAAAGGGTCFTLTLPRA